MNNSAHYIISALKYIGFNLISDENSENKDLEAKTYETKKVNEKTHITQEFLDYAIKVDFNINAMDSTLKTLENPNEILNTLNVCKSLKIKKSEIINDLIDKESKVLTNFKKIHNLMYLFQEPNFNNILLSSYILDLDLIKTSKQWYQLSQNIYSKTPNKHLDSAADKNIELFKTLESFATLEKIPDNISVSEFRKILSSHFGWDIKSLTTIKGLAGECCLKIQYDKVHEWNGDILSNIWFLSQFD